MRENGTVGVRNEVWIIPTVGCVNSIARAIEATARANKPEGVDEVVAFPHPYGCSQVTEDQENTRHVLADLINHPNAGAVLVLGLGCENSRIEVLKDYIGEVNPDRVKFLQVQDVENEQEAAEGIMKELMSYAATFMREKIFENKTKMSSEEQVSAILDSLLKLIMRTPFGSSSPIPTYKRLFPSPDKEEITLQPTSTKRANSLV